MVRGLYYFFAGIFLASVWATPAMSAPAMGLGYTPKYPANFSHFDYVNPDAPKGGELVLAERFI